ncbi:MAG: hypothetical protein P4L53_03480 [Candidatus Obscuribacterales bacterium]|nr:hypothetical protein [Candidatus Obscuribacterales bacterium]
MFGMKATFFITLALCASLNALEAKAQGAPFVLGQMPSNAMNTGSMAAGGSGASPTGYNPPPSSPKAAAKFAAQQAAFNASLVNMTPAQRAVAIAAQQAKLAAKKAAAQALKFAKQDAAVMAQRTATGNLFGPYDPSGFQFPWTIPANQVFPPPIGVGLWADGYGGENSTGG